VSKFFGNKVLNIEINHKRRKIIILVIFLLISISLSFVSSVVGLMYTSVLTAMVLGIFFVFLNVIEPKLGYFFSLLIPFISFEFERYFKLNIPTSLLLQLIFLLLIVIILLKRKIRGDLSFGFLNNPIFYILLISFIYLLIQSLNPSMHSIQGWLFALRSILGRLLVYLVALLLIEDIKFIKQFFFVWIFLAFISSLYACYQEWFGLPAFILNYIHSDPLKLGLYFINGKYRVFSLLSDPAAFGIFMAGSFLVTFILALGNKAKSLRLLLMIVAGFMLLASGFSGTRTGYAMVPAGLLLYILMTINSKRTLLITTVGSLFIAVLLFGPIYGNSTINRVRSTFTGDDASLSVRDLNRARIQSYIYDNPLGGGVLTTGVAGKEYNPNHVLAGFPPDSGYLQVVLETGWLGLLLKLLVFFVVLKVGINNYYRSTNSEIKSYYLAIIVFVFSVSIASYAQVVIGQVPMSLFFYSAMAFVSKLERVEYNSNRQI